jgi:anti-anti-sigma factor
VRTRGDEVYIRFFSRVLSEAAASEIVPELLEMIDRGECRRLFLDLCRVERLSSSMLAKTVKLTRSMDTQGGELRLINVCADVRRTFSVTRLDQIVEIAEGETGTAGVASNGVRDVQ